MAEIVISFYSFWFLCLIADQTSCQNHPTVPLPYTWICEMYMGCSYIYTLNIGSRNTKNTYNFPVQVRNFLLSLSLKVFRHKEREAQSFNSGFFICPSPHLVRYLPKASASKRKSTFLVRCLVSTLLTFFKFPKSSARFWYMTSFALASPVSHLGLLWHLWVTCLFHPRVRMNTCVNVASK